MTHTLIQLQSYLFIKSQPKGWFPVLIFLWRVPTWYLLPNIPLFYPVSHFETANGIPLPLKALFNNVFPLKKSELQGPTCYQCLW